MNFDKINKWLSLLGNIGVVFGLIFLVIEIQNNSKTTEAQTRDSVADKLITWQLAISANEFTANAFYKGWTDEELTPAELMAYTQLVQSSLRMWENEWYQYQIGLYSKEEFLPRLERMESSMSICSFKRIWGNGNLYSPSFRELINGLIDKAPPIKCE